MERKLKQKNELSILRCQHNEASQFWMWNSVPYEQNTIAHRGNVVADVFTLLDPRGHYILRNCWPAELHTSIDMQEC